MKPVVRNLLVGLRDFVIVLALLVWLARSDQMPQVVPPQVTDFLVDMTDIVFGSGGGGAGAAATDLADLALYGETDREARRDLELYKARIENWFARVLDNVDGIVTHPLVRRALPDFGQELSLMFAEDYLGGLITRYGDIDEILLHGQGGVFLRTTRENREPLPPEVVPQKILEKARAARGAILEPLPGQRFMLLASFLSPMRERQGTVVVVLNASTLKKLVAEYPGSGDSRLYLHVRGNDPLIESGQGSWGALPERALRHERFLDTRAGRKRNLALPVRIAGSESGIIIGLLSPPVDSSKLLLLGVRFLILVLTIFVTLWLVRRILSGIWKIIRTHGMREQLLLHALDASLGHGKKILEGAKRITTVRPRVERRIIRTEAPRTESVRPKVAPGAGMPADFQASGEPDLRRYERFHLDPRTPVAEGEFVIIDGPVDLPMDADGLTLPDMEPAAPAPIDD
ncbi:MAG TPA: cache domain-containing protein [Spirochaetota bacterium]|nr:cache domain-containing protein [Spirochaetota bacterium]